MVNNLNEQNKFKCFNYINLHLSNDMRYKFNKEYLITIKKTITEKFNINMDNTNGVKGLSTMYFSLNLKLIQKVNNE